MNNEFFAALELLEKEKGIPKAYMIEKIEAALLSAFKKEYGNGTNVRVQIDEVKKDVRVYQQHEVVEVVEDPLTQISLEDAKAISKRYTVGKVVETEVKPKNFRRLSAAAAKSVIIQGIREGERRAMQEAYENKREEIITATVDKVDFETGNVLLATDDGRAVLRYAKEQPRAVSTRTGSESQRRPSHSRPRRAQAKLLVTKSPSELRVPPPSVASPGRPECTNTVPFHCSLSGLPFHWGREREYCK